LSLHPPTPLRPLLALALLGVAFLPAAGKDRGEQLRLDLMPVSLDRPLALYYRHDGKVGKLEAFHTAMGTPLFYRGPARLAFYQDEAAAQPAAGDEPPPPPLVTVQLPANCRRVLLVFSAGTEDNKPQVRAWPVADDRLRAGDYRLINVSHTPVAGTLGKERFSLNPGQTADLSRRPWRQRGHDLPVRFTIPRNGRAMIVYSTIWSHYPARRNYVFFIGGAGRAAPVVRKFHDLPGVDSIGHEPEKPPR